jgi:DNA polymerase-3 subunit epsilon
MGILKFFGRSKPEHIKELHDSDALGPELESEVFDFVAVDVETASGSIISICQIGISAVRGGRIVDRYTSLVRPPENAYHSANSIIHGIYPEDTKEERSFKEVWPEIARYFKSKLVAHNASFDRSRIEATLNHYKIEHPGFHFDCTYQLTNLKLDEACSHYGIELNNHHNALADADACAQLFVKILSGEQPVGRKKVVTRMKGSKPVTDAFEKKKIASELLQPDLNVADNYFKGKRLVFTGDLSSMSRQEAAELLRSLGADINTSISKKTDVVIMGGNPGPSKLKKIEEIKQAGFPIQVILEEEFLSHAQA